MIRGQLGWKRVHDPILVSATALIGLSVVGFMMTMRHIMVQLYVIPPWFAELTALFLGLSLLGGGGDIRFGFFPYDLPHTFVFALSLTTIFSGSGWLLPVFAVAAYSKETSLLLIPAYILVNWGRRDWRLISTVTALTITYVVVRIILDWSYGSGAGGFWFPGRNARWIAWMLTFDAWWYYPFWIVSAIRLARVWPQFPAPLRRLVLLSFALIAPALFKGWIEEKRQYLEMLPILGPMLIQWVVTELGFGCLLRAREF